MTENSGLF